MDPVCHTLAGAALAESGLKRRTALGMATLLIGANLADVDVVSYVVPGGPAADLALRRGWTHGVLALLLLPLLLTAAVVGFDRLRARLRRRERPSAVQPREVLLLAVISIFSHPILDTLNTYGVRWLMPFDGRWFYGDTLFIADPWLWLVLGIGVWLSRRGGRRIRRVKEIELDSTRPARIALLFGAAYIASMGLGGLAARARVRAEMQRRTGERVEELMLSPVAANPFRRTFVAAQGASYRTGEFHWLRRPQVAEAVEAYPRGRPADPAAAAAVEAAASTRTGHRFLSWARFPTFSVERGPGGGATVHIVDVRYARRPGTSFGAVSIPVPAGAP